MIKTVAVVGAGTMGQGIAQVAARAGFTTLLFDVSPEQTSRAIETIERNYLEAVGKGRMTVDENIAALEKLQAATSVAELKADLVIEAAVEKLDIKQSLLRELEKVNAGTAILATNTSSLSVLQIASTLKDPSRCIGLHFFNPADRMKLVEIIAADSTDPKWIEVLRTFARSIEKTPVLAKDSPGFIVNRVARHFYLESLSLFEEGAADIQSIDALVKSMGYKMGPFELMDLIGVDTNLAVTRSVYEGFRKASRFRPRASQEKMVKDGNLGRKTGKGFYDYRSA